MPDTHPNHEGGELKKTQLIPKVSVVSMHQPLQSSWLYSFFILLKSIFFLLFTSTVALYLPSNSLTIFQNVIAPNVNIGYLFQFLIIFFCIFS